MKRIIKSRVFAFVLGALIFGSIGVVSAYTIFADNIGYTPSDTTWKKSNGEDITNVKDAIDELYTKANKTPTQVATLTTQGATYTMQNDGYIVGTVGADTDKWCSGVVYLDGVNVFYDYPQDSGGRYPSIYASEGTVVFTRANCGTYNLTVYEWK